MKKLFSLLFLLLASDLSAQTSGYLTRANCATITSPVEMSVACLQTTTTDGRTAGHIYVLRGGFWTDVDTAGTLDPTLEALAVFNSTGILTQTAPDTFVSRILTGVTNEITITNPAGTAGNPLIGLASTIDLGAKTAVTPWRIGTTAPATCTVGQGFFDTDAAAGSNVLGCTATNVWTVQGGTGSGGSGHTVQEEGASLAARTGLNFIGAAITAADDSANNATTITLSASPDSGSVVGTGRTITTNAPLGGGGDLTANLTLTCTTCATASGAASGEIAVFTSGTALDSHAALGFDGTDLTLGDVSTNYVRLITAALTAPRTLTVPDVDTVTVAPSTATATQFLTHITSGGIQTKAQPAFSDISGVNTVAKGGTSIATIAANKLLGSVGLDTIQEIAIGANLTLSAGTLSATGGSGTPGGSTTQIQYNNAGAFGGSAEFTWDNTNTKQVIGTDPGIDTANTPRLFLNHDGTWGELSSAGVGTGAGNVGIKLTTEGTGRVQVNSLATTGAATGKTMVCADTNGALYRSSSATNCLN